MTRISAIALRWHNSPYMAQKIEREAIEAGWVSPEAHEAAVTRAEKAEAEARTCAEDYADQSDRYDRLEASLRESDAALQAAREETEKAECATRYQKSLYLQAERFQMEAEAKLARVEALEKKLRATDWDNPYVGHALAAAYLIRDALTEPEHDEEESNE